MRVFLVAHQLMKQIQGSVVLCQQEYVSGFPVNKVQTNQLDLVQYCSGMGPPMLIINLKSEISKKKKLIQEYRKGQLLL